MHISIFITASPLIDPLQVNQRMAAGMILSKYYIKFTLMKKKGRTSKGPGSNDKKEKELPGYPLYPASEDIYNRYTKEENINPEDNSRTKESNENPNAGKRNEKDFTEDVSGDDLDVPGSELDDQQESVGSEDEENNYYSLGGDNHNDLEEDKA